MSKESQASSRCIGTGIGRRLRQARYALGYRTQEVFGKALGGITKNRMSRAERGENLIPTEMLYALADKGININWLLTGKGAMQKGAAADASRETLLALADLIRESLG